MNRNKTLGIFAALVVLIGLGVYAYMHYTPSVSVSNTDDSAVRMAVTAFGTQMQFVPLLANAAERKAAMEKQYVPYVAPELIAQWAPEGAEALGRSTSSPWPERINIMSATPKGRNAYVVEGNVIEVVNTSTSTAPAAVYPVVLTMQKRGESWLIVKAEKGAYSEIPHSQTIVGFWECLPHKNPDQPHTLECAFGIAVDQSDGHYAVNTALMSRYPVDYPTGTKVRITGVVTPANQLSSIQQYDIDGIISATSIEKI